MEDFGGGSKKSTSLVFVSITGHIIYIQIYIRIQQTDKQRFQTIEGQAYTNCPCG